MQGDNNLSSCVGPDIEEIIKAHCMAMGSQFLVNTLVQVDYHQDQKKHGVLELIKMENLMMGL